MTLSMSSLFFLYLFVPRVVLAYFSDFLWAPEPVLCGYTGISTLGSHPALLHLPRQSRCRGLA